MKEEVSEKEEKWKVTQTKIGTIFIVSLLALAGLGISYAGFTDAITVYGTVDTATVDIEVVPWYSGTWVWKIWGDTYTGDEIHIFNGWVQDKPSDADVLNMYVNEGVTDVELEACSFAQPGTTHGDIVADVDFIYNDIFPCIDFGADFIVHYAGSIPAKVDSSIILESLNEYVIATGVDATGWLANLYNNFDYAATGFGIGIVVQEVDPIYDVNDVITGWTYGNMITDITGYQLHYCDYIYVKVIIHLPQDNMWQGLHGEFYTTIGVTQWNDECNGQLTDKTVDILLPTYPVDILFEHPYLPDVSYWKETIVGPGTTTLPGGPFNDPLDDNLPIVCIGWCVDRDNFITPGSTLSAMLYSAYDTVNNPYLDEDWPKVAWLINNKDEWPTATYEQFQYAIWEYIDGGYSDSDPVVLNMISRMMNEGSTFVPQTGQMIPVVVWIPGHQTTFIEVDP